ncbi:MAG: GAF domain-containing protein [Cyanobacteria bacterium P01_F01_bin.53]
MATSVQQQEQQQLQGSRHDLDATRSPALLAGVAEAAKRLLSIADFDAAVNGALDAIAQSANIDRIFIVENHLATPSQSEFGSCPYEWTVPGVVRSREVPGRFPMVYSEIEGFSDWLGELKAGKPVQKTKGEMSDDGQAIQDIDQAFSVLTVPIFVEGVYWGNFGFDDCTVERVWSDAEIAVLETAAANFAAALQRRESLADLETYNRELRQRDALLNSVNAAAQCLVATDELAVAIPRALRILGEGTQQDRVYVFENLVDSKTKQLSFEMPFEWVAPKIPASIESAIFPLPATSLPDFVVNLSRNGLPVQFLTRELEGIALALNEEVKTLSLITVPIQVEGKWWGMLGFDDCTTERVWSDSEVAVLETAAACMGSAIERDRTRKEKEAAAQARAAELAERDRILEATAAAANVMLTDDDFESAIDKALKIVGEGLGVDRVGFMQHFEATEGDGFGYHCQLNEWTSVGTALQMEHPELNKISDEGVEFFDSLMRGDIGGGIVDELAEPFRSGQKELGVKSTYAIPIMVNASYWGIIGIDDCHNLTRRSEAELEALMTLTNCIGSAIERDLNQKAREAAERRALIAQERAARSAELEAANKVLTTRDRWLQTTAVAANQLLSSGDVEASVQVAIQTIGENLGCDRVSVMQYLPTYEAHPLGAMKMLYEWDAPGISAQTADPELNIISAEGIEDWFTQLLAGEWVGGDIADLPEPARSGQQSLGVKSTYAVPVFFEEALWGLVTMDYCHQAKRLEPSELAVFETAATCVGSAIYQDVVRRDRAAQERARLLGSVAKAANLLLRSADYLTVLPEVVRLLGESVACDRCSVIQEIENSDTIHIITEWTQPTIKTSVDTNPEMDSLLVWSNFSSFHEQYQRGETANFIVADIEEPARSILASQGCTSLLIVPIMVQGSCWGEIGFDNCGEPRLYDEAEISILKVAAESIAAAIARQAQDEALRHAEKAVLEEREKAARDRVTELAKANEAIGQTLNALTATPELDEFLGQILAKMAEPIGACKAHLFLYEESTHTLHQHVAIQNGQVYQGAAPTDPEMFRHPIPADLSRAWQIIVESPKPFTWDERNPEAADSYWPDSVTWHQAEGHLSSTCACMKVGNRPIGFIGFAFRHLPTLTNEQLEFIQTLTNQATLSIHLTRLADEAKQSAILQEQEKAAQDRATELAKTNEAINQTLTALATDPETSTFLGLLLQALAKQTGACKTHLFLYDAETHTLNHHCAVEDGTLYMGVAPGNPKMFEHPIPADLTGGWQAILDSPLPLTFDDLGYQDNPNDLWWPETIPWHRNEGHSEVACSRMKVGEIPIGYIGFAFRDRANLSPVQLEFIQALTNQATLSVHLTRLADQSKKTALSAALTNERNRLAREIHDTLAQSFTGVSLQLEAAKGILNADPDTARTYINRAGKLARQGLSEARRSVRALRSQALETDALPVALQTSLTEMTQESTLQTEFQLIGTPYALPDDIQTNLLRIGQEAITNALRYANADNLLLTLQFKPNSIHMSIADDGRGSHITSLADVEGFGLLGMRERVLRFDGHFAFNSTPGKGTVIEISIPTQEEF